MTTTRCLWSCLSAWLCPWLWLAALPAQTLQLADGQVLLAKVEDAYGEGVRVLRLDNGGALELRWEHLSPDCAQRVKVAFGLAGDEQSEIQVTVSEVRWLQNGTPQTIFGRVTDNNPAADHIVVQQKGVPYRIPRAEIRQVRQIEVPVSQVFTPDEFYSQRLGELQPGESSDKHRQLAEDLVRVRDYERAREHLQRAKDLANSRAPEQIDALLERVKVYVQSKDQRLLLDQVVAARMRASLPEFDKGTRLIAQFEKDYPQSKLKGEFDAEKKRFQEARTRFLAGQVAEHWRRSISTAADKKVQEAGLTLGGAREYAESKMGDDIAELVAQRLKIELDECKQLFATREKYPAGRRTEHFSYGIGSWVLGEAAIQKDTKQGDEKQGPGDPAAERELKRLEDAIRKAQEAARARGKGQGQGGGGAPAREQTEDEWWTSSERPDKANWLRAYYAEFGGHCKLVGAYTQACMICGGLGKVSQLGPGNKVIKVNCELCHGTKWMRTFRAF